MTMTYPDDVEQALQLRAQYIQELGTLGDLQRDLDRNPELTLLIQDRLRMVLKAITEMDKQTIFILGSEVNETPTK